MVGLLEMDIRMISKKLRASNSIIVPTTIRQLLEGLGQIAKETGVRVQTHLSECRPEGSFFNYIDQILPII